MGSISSAEGCPYPVGIKLFFIPICSSNMSVLKFIFPFLSGPPLSSASFHLSFIYILVTVYVCTKSVLTLYCVELDSGTCAKLDEAVSTTLEMEAYTLKPGRVVASVQGEEEREGESAAAVVEAQDPLAVAVERLTARLQKLESECFLARQYSSKQYTGRPAPKGGGQGTGPTGGRSQFPGKCWRCGTPGHLARDCSQNPPPTGN